MENIYSKISELQRERKAFVLTTLTNVDSSVPQALGAKMLVFSDGKIYGTIGGGNLERTVIYEAQKLLKSSENKVVKNVYNLSKKKRREKNIALGMLCGGEAEIMFEVFIPNFDLVICGAGHIGEKLAQFSDILGFSYAVVDNRPSFANEKRFPRASKIICPTGLRKKFSDGLKELKITSKTAVVIVTYGHIYDYECLKTALKTPSYYIGMIGSKNKVTEVFKWLKKEKIKTTDNVYAPVGLDLGGDSPSEIAISILSEIMKVKNNKTGKSLKSLMKREI